MNEPSYRTELEKVRRDLDQACRARDDARREAERLHRVVAAEMKRGERLEADLAEARREVTEAQERAQLAEGMERYWTKSAEQWRDRTVRRQRLLPHSPLAPEPTDPSLERRALAAILRLALRLNSGDADSHLSGTMVATYRALAEKLES